MSVTVEFERATVLEALGDAKRRALEGVGVRAAGYARGLAPVRTGALRDSIGWAVDGDELMVGAGAAYAVNVEFGAKPFLRPAMEEHAREYEENVEREFFGGEQGDDSLSQLR